MISKKHNFCTLNIGGVERTLKFSMGTQELYLDTITELSKDKKLNIDNPITQIKVLFYCALIIGNASLKETLTIAEVGTWIDDCDDERFEQANDFAVETMGFISSVEQSQFHRQMEKIQSMGMNPSEILEKALSSKS
jgi:hypothetical protein